MDFFIKKIFEGNTDEFVHLQFQKFSKGEFKNRAMLRIKNSKGNFSVNTTPEYAKEIILTLGEKLGEKKVRVTGALISAVALNGFDYKEKKSAIGINKYMIDGEMSGYEIADLCKKVPRAFFGLSFSNEDFELKIPVKSPKSAKAAGSPKEGEKAKIDFCKLKTKDRGIIEALVFDSEAAGFKEVEIKHDFIIDSIVIPEEMKKKNDFALLRESALRKGRVIRTIKVDGKEFRKEAEFEA